MLFSLFKHHFDLNVTDTALKVSQSLYCFTTSISHGATTKIQVKRYERDQIVFDIPVER